MAAGAAIDDLPGYRRRIVVTPGAGRVVAAMEDDYHHMTVTIDHAAGIATRIEGRMHRQPWSTCPGAEARLVETFAGVALDRFEARGEKAANCTHLHDLALLGAAHAGDAAPLIYDVLRTDPAGIERRSRAILRRDGATVLDWTLEGFTIAAPAEEAGLDLFRLKPLLERLDPAGQEAAKVLRWAVMVGSGRQIPLADQSDATKMPPTCFNFQPDVARHARRIGMIRDFPAEQTVPLDGRTPDGGVGAITENERV